MQPDSQPLSGIENPTLGTPEMLHSYWIPGIEYSNNAKSNSLNPMLNYGWNTTSFVSGDVSLFEAWSHSLLSAEFFRWRFFSQRHNRLWEIVKCIGSRQRTQIDDKGWQLLFVDQITPTCPESTFGFGGAELWIGFSGDHGDIGRAFTRAPEYLRT